MISGRLSAEDVEAGSEAGSSSSTSDALDPELDAEELYRQSQQVSFDFLDEPPLHPIEGLLAGALPHPQTPRSPPSDLDSHPEPHDSALLSPNLSPTSSSWGYFQQNTAPSPSQAGPKGPQASPSQASGLAVDLRLIPGLDFSSGFLTPEQSEARWGRQDSPVAAHPPAHPPEAAPRPAATVREYDGANSPPPAAVAAVAAVPEWRRRQPLGADSAPAALDRSAESLGGGHGLGVGAESVSGYNLSAAAADRDGEGASFPPPAVSPLAAAGPKLRRMRSPGSGWPAAADLSVDSADGGSVASAEYLDDTHGGGEDDGRFGGPESPPDDAAAAADNGGGAAVETAATTAELIKEVTALLTVLAKNRGQIAQGGSAGAGSADLLGRGGKGLGGEGLGVESGRGVVPGATKKPAEKKKKKKPKRLAAAVVKTAAPLVQEGVSDGRGKSVRANMKKKVAVGGGSNTAQGKEVKPVVAPWLPPGAGGQSRV